MKNYSAFEVATVVVKVTAPHLPYIKPFRAGLELYDLELERYWKRVERLWARIYAEFNGDIGLFNAAMAVAVLPEDTVRKEALINILAERLRDSPDLRFDLETEYLPLYLNVDIRDWLDAKKSISISINGGLFTGDIIIGNKSIRAGGVDISHDVMNAGDIIRDRDIRSSCYIYAEMDDRVIIDRITTLGVTVSGDELQIQSSQTSLGAKVSVDSTKRLIVQVIPKTNFSIIDEEDRVEVNPPTQGQQFQIYFDLKPTHLGEGEVWVVVRQGQMPLLTLSLKPQILETRLQSPSKTKVDGSILDFPPPSEPLHQLRIIEQRNGDRIIYRYELESPELSLLNAYESLPITSQRQEHVENLYREIESRWISNQDDVEAFTAELRAFGGNLFDELFPSELRSLLWQNYSQIKSIMVLSTEPFIPWELVHLKQPNQTNLPEETIFLGQMGLVRWLYGTFPAQTIKIREGRARYIIPHYPDSRYQLPQAEEEAEFLEQTFHAQAIEPQSTPVRKLLETGNFDLLHFAGHGTADLDNVGNSKLMLQGRMDENTYIPNYLSATTIGQFANLKSVDKNSPMIVLNACQIGREGYTYTSLGGFAQAFLKGGASAFIGPLWSVGDRSARIFTETLYKELIKGLTLSEATVIAREQARHAGDATWLAYAVYGHPHLRIQLYILEDA